MVFPKTLAASVVNVSLGGMAIPCFSSPSMINVSPGKYQIYLEPLWNDNLAFSPTLTTHAYLPFGLVMLPLQTVRMKSMKSMIYYNYMLCNDVCQEDDVIDW